MTEYVISRSNARVTFVYRQVKNVDLKTKTLLVSVVIPCRFDHPSTSWYSCVTRRHKARLQYAQNKIIRFPEQYFEYYN